MTADAPDDAVDERILRLMFEEATDVLFLLGVEPGARYRFLCVNPA
ncbi:MAG: hypothetical protein GWN73_29670, partial [Actinobacteria bacterium]|nr:hypothetical protein [Actinomycetota bacterium]NIU69340.1 hypothetical protein [Actinomycetota bacterium]NIV89309.1 hypothetical protein [Actinomycetota bacterium]NIW31203.1 hypothetical protein [Actinomycetota bacterium]NIX52582.1 hypothetical protein [Actinomycetota bacterium]